MLPVTQDFSYKDELLTPQMGHDYLNHELTVHGDQLLPVHVFFPEQPSWATSPPQWRSHPWRVQVVCRAWLSDPGQSRT